MESSATNLLRLSSSLSAVGSDHGLVELATPNADEDSLKYSIEEVIQSNFNLYRRPGVCETGKVNLQKGKFIFGQTEFVPVNYRRFGMMEQISFSTAFSLRRNQLSIKLPLLLGT